MEISDASGNVLASFTPPKAYNSVVISAPGINKGETYTVKAGSFSTEITMTDIIYGAGMQWGMPGGRPEGKPESPDFKNDPRSLNDESKRL